MGGHAWMWARSELRRRWPALVVLGLLAGVTTGLAAAAVAGARRTDTAWEGLRDVTRASDAIVFASQAGIYRDDELRYDAVADLPYVQGLGAFGLMYMTTDAGDGGVFLSTHGDWLAGLDTPRIVEGRAPAPDDPHEVVMSKPDPGSDLADMGVGDTIQAQAFTQEQQFAGRSDEAEGPAFTFEIVGVADGPFNMAAIPSAGAVYVGPAFREHYGPGLALFSNLTVRLEDPERDLARLEADVARLYPGRGVPVYDLAAAGKRVTNGTDLERSGLLLFAGAVVAAGMVIIGQALTRSVRAAGADVPTLVALGFSRRDAAYALALPHVVSAVVAAVVTLGLAVALSPRFPIGLGRRVDPDVGLHVDVPVVVGGAALVVAALGGAVAWSAWRAAAAVGESSWTARSGVASMLLRVGAPVPTSIGAGLALEPGRGQRALPTRPALVGAATGVLGIIGASTLGAGIDDASRHPERFGAVWDVEVTVPDVPDEVFRSAPDSLAADPDVAAVARVARLTVPVGDLVLPFYALDEIEGSMDFALLGGRPPQSPDEVVLGPDSAETLGVGVGDEIEVGDGGAFRVVGLGLLPTTAHSSFDQGGWLMPDGLARSVTDTQRHAIAEDMGTDHAPTDAELSRDMFHFFGGVFARFHGGVDERAAIARLAGQIGDTVTVAPPSEPADQLNLRNVRPLPFLFAGFSLALAVAALAHISATVLRRRRGELAVLRSLGMTPLQVRACLGWQATTLAAVGLVVGVPLGMALGRLAWRAVADATPMIYVAPLAVLALALAVPVALTVANLVAALPGQRAARLRPAEVLRTE